MNASHYAQHISTFVEVVRLGSFSAAARKYGVTPSAITRKIDDLEDFIGARLLTRSTRSITTTETGEALFKRAEKVLNELNDMYSEISSISNSLEGTLRISCFPTFGKLHIIPWLTSMKSKHPNLHIELDLTERITNPSLERLDSAIRIGKLKDSSLYASKIAVQRWIVCCSPDYFKKYSPPSNCRELKGQAIVDKLRDPSGVCWKHILHEEQYSHLTVSFRCDDFDGLRQAALQGLGLAYLPNWVVQQDIKNGNLIQVFEDSSRPEENIYLLRSSAKASIKLETFSEALKSHLDLNNLTE